jgi:RNA polymerase sigma factor (sigma-70 family)
MSDSFSQYLSEASRYPLLNKSQEIMLARQVQVWLHDKSATPRQKVVGKRAYEKLINCNLRLVVSVAKKFSGRMRRSDMADLVQEGNIGLAHGVKKFDPERGYALSTYVYWWIRQAVSRYLSCSDRVIRLPSHAVELLGKLRAWTPVFENAHGRKPTIEECAEYCKTSPVRMKEYIDKSNDAISLDAKVRCAEDDVALIDSVSCGTDVLEDVSWSIDVEKLDNSLSGLSERDRFIVEEVYGIGTGSPKTFQVVAKQLGISRERTRNLFHKAIRKLQMKHRL